VRRLSAGKRDAGEAEIFQAFEAAGCSIIPISSTGAPDAVVFTRTGHAYLVECKARLGTLTKAQIKFRETWRGPPIHIVRSSVEALALVTGRPVPQD